MPQYTQTTPKVSNPPGRIGDGDRKKVNFCNPDTQVWEYVELMRCTHRVRENHYEAAWRVVGTTDRLYPPKQLNDLYRAGSLHIVTDREWDMLAGSSSLKSVNPRRRLHPEVRARIEFDRETYEIDEATGRNDRLRRELAGLTDFKVSLEGEQREATEGHTKLSFFRGAESFQGSLYHSPGAAIPAGRAACKITKLMNMKGARFSSVPVTGVIPEFAGSITLRCKDISEAQRIADEIAQLTGHSGMVRVSTLGSSAMREINYTSGVRFDESDYALAS